MRIRLHGASYSGISDFLSIAGAHSANKYNDYRITKDLILSYYIVPLREDRQRTKSKGQQPATLLLSLDTRKKQLLSAWSTSSDGQTKQTKNLPSHPFLSSIMGSTAKLVDLAGDGGSWFAEINDQWLVICSPRFEAIIRMLLTFRLQAGPGHVH